MCTCQGDAYAIYQMTKQQYVQQSEHKCILMVNKSFPKGSIWEGAIDSVSKIEYD